MVTVNDPSGHGSEVPDVDQRSRELMTKFLKGGILRGKRLQAKVELKRRCPVCPAARRKSRDILGEGDCFWYMNWSRGCYNIRSYRAYRLLALLGIKRPVYLDGPPKPWKADPHTQ